MENADAFVASIAPVTCHDFLERMRHPSASDFVKSIKRFVFFWVEEVKHDQELSEKMALVQQFVRPENLDILPGFQNETSWLLAQKELQKINMYKAPRDKIVCILNCCKVITNLLLNASLASNDNPPGADEFLPVLIYVTIKANPPQLHSNLLYIQRYRRQSRLVSEAAYFFTNMLSAESFISSINAQSLSMDDVEFDKNMQTAHAILSGLSTGTETFSIQSSSDQEVSDDKKSKSKPKSLVSDPGTDSSDQYTQGSTKFMETKLEPIVKVSSGTDDLSISNLEIKGAAALLREDQISSSFREYPFLYAQAGDLTVVDVEALLEDYKRLVLRYVSLSKGFGGSSDKPSNTIQRITSQGFEDLADQE